MHLPSGMLDGTICPVTAVVSAAGIAAAAIAATRQKEQPGAARFAAVTALVFAAQMLNFPVQQGTSGHLLGGVLAASLLGIPFGILSLALVVLVQCLAFADGGFSVLGANILNMALIGAGAGGAVYHLLARRMPASLAGRCLAMASGGWFSVMLASFAVSVQLAVSGTVSFAEAGPAMLGIHALIGIGEGLMTAGLFLLVGKAAEEKISGRARTWAAMTGAVLFAAILSPFASGSPDGLEWVAQKYRFFHEQAPSFVSPFHDYSISIVTHEGVSTATAGLAGVVMICAAGWFIIRSLDCFKNPRVS